MFRQHTSANRSRPALLAIAVYALFVLMPGVHALVHDHAAHLHAPDACAAGTACAHTDESTPAGSPECAGTHEHTEHEQDCVLCEAFSTWGSPHVERDHVRPTPAPTARLTTGLARSATSVPLRAPNARGPPSFAG